MDEQNLNRHTEPTVRPVGSTELSWCKSVPTGTGITVVALFLSKPPNISLLQNALDKLQNHHPILRSKLRFDATANTFSFVTPPLPHVKIQPFDLQSTAQILRSSSFRSSVDDDPYQAILEHELNTNTWRDHYRSSDTIDLVFLSVYNLEAERSAVVMRVHTSVCDRTAAVTVLKELLVEAGGHGGDGEAVVVKIGNEEVVEGSLGIEELVPVDKSGKWFWTRGMDMIGYSLNSFRLSNLNFEDIVSPRNSRVVRLRMTAHETSSLLNGCKSRGIKLCGALAAAGLIAAHSSNHIFVDHNRWEKYAVVTLMDCRSLLQPPLDTNHLGFYHSAILNTHDLNGGENLWDLAKRCYTSFSDARNLNKHFTDMTDLSYLMIKAIENPTLTPSSAMRTAFISVFEDLIMDESTELHKEIGLDDYVGCSSVHGVGPSVAVFDTVRDGKLDCACVYPWPLHSSEQMEKLIGDMKKILVDGSKDFEIEEEKD